MMSPNASINVKRYLLGVNRDLQRIVDEVRRKNQYWFLHEIGEFPRGDKLTNIEVAVLSLEDRRFFRHFGFEIRALPRLVRRYIRVRKIGGISTVEQQVVRIVTKRNARKLSRKLTEVLLAIAMNFHLNKREVLHFYINSAYLGPGLIGAASASRLFFQKPLEELSLQESALIAALFPLPAPKIILRMMDDLDSGLKPEEILEYSRQHSPRWSAEVGFRYRLALQRNYRTLNKR